MHNILEELYNLKYDNINYIHRKVSLTNQNTILFYSPYSGASSCIFEFIHTLEPLSYLYIDFSDLRISKQYIQENLNNFLKANVKIKTLIIDNFDTFFDIKTFDFYNSTINILSVSHHKHITKTGYKNIYLYPLDFEEYLSFHSYDNIEHTFSDFIQDISYPDIVLKNKALQISKLQNFLKKQSKDEIELEILKTLIKSQGLLKSNYQIYNSLKQSIKISKDRLYEYIEKIQDKNIIFFIDKYNVQKSAKKIQLIDFNLRQAVSFKKNIYLSLENAVFLEIFKKTRHKIYYTDNINFYIEQTKLAIIISLFLEKEVLENKLKKFIKNIANLNVDKVLIIGINEEFSFYIENIKFIAMPFYVFTNEDLVL